MNVLKNFKFKELKQHFKGKSRGAKAKRQILYSILIQGVNVVIGLLYVPLLLNFLTQEKYGIWLTLISIIGWFSFLDIGLGNGLRNKLTEAIANNDLKLGKKLVSSTYGILVLIFSIVLIIFHISNIFLDWNKILNTKTIDATELYILASVVFTFFFIRFVVQIISVIYLADQRPSFINFINTLANLISFLIILLLTRFYDQGDLVLLGTIISAVPVLLFILVSVVSFNNRYKALKPSVRSIDFKASRGIMNLGLQFFLLQVSFIIIETTANFFITQFYGPGEVAVYNIAHKYFNIPLMVFLIFMNPIWSAVTDAYVKQDFAWLKRTLKYANILSVIFIVGTVLMIIISDKIYKIWVGSEITIPFSLSVSLGFLTMFALFFTPYTFFINGIGKLRLTVILTFFEIALYLIMVFVFGKMFHDSTGVVLAIILTGILAAIIHPIQTYKLLNKTASGIWNR